MKWEAELIERSFSVHHSLPTGRLVHLFDIPTAYLHSRMKKTVLTILQYGFFFGLGLFFVWLSVRQINAEQWAQIKDAIRRARLWLIVPVCVMLMLSHYSRALRWRILMEPLGYKPSAFNTFAAVMIGYLVNAGVPRLGEVVKCTLLARYEKVRADKLVGTIVMERAVDVVCLVAVFLLALLTQGHVIGGYVQNLFSGIFQSSTGATSVNKILLYAGGLMLIVGVLYFLLKRFGHVDAVSKAKAVVRGVLNGLQSIRYVKRKGLFLFHSIAIWTLYLLSTTLGLYALRETAPLGIGGGLTTLAVGSVGMVLTPGGIGAYPLLVASLMGLYGLNEKITGTALGWMLWSVQTVIVLVSGVVLAALFSYYNKNKKAGEARTRLSEEDTAAP